MSEGPRKKSPRAPSIALEEAIDRVRMIYEKEGRHPAPYDIIAQNIGYKNANNGAALSALASIRYYGLLERPKDGYLAVTKDVESYLYAPSEALKKSILTNWLKTPQIFSDLLSQYEGGLPSDATIRYALINKGFTPVAAESTLAIFKRSLEFVGFYETTKNEVSDAVLVQSATANPIPPIGTNTFDSDIEPLRSVQPASFTSSGAGIDEDQSLDRIPVRLSVNRRAWLVIPTPFFEADKARLKAQIDLLLTDDEGVDLAG